MDETLLGIVVRPEVTLMETVYHDHLDRLDEGFLPIPDVTEAKMLVFLVITIQVGHRFWHRLPDYCAMSDQLQTPFGSNTTGNVRKRITKF
jgi:hypothetical protein